VESCEIVRQWLSAATSVTVLTGAGISAESGVPTFRGPGGLWRNHRPEDLATPQAFARDPLQSWEWYNWRRGVIATVQPNAGHTALARIEERSPRFTLVTQNVDGLHDRAGSQHILKVHGDIWTLRCTRCTRAWPDLRPELPELPPLCKCGAMARPGVVWFGEGLPEDVWRQSVEAARACDVFLLVGTSAVVYPAAGLAEMARSHGAKVVEINIEDTPLSGHVDLSWRARAAEALPMLAE
jgi:NAD-dependent protein deacetylase/lipoamidase